MDGNRVEVKAEVSGAFAPGQQEALDKLVALDEEVSSTQAETPVQEPAKTKAAEPAKSDEKPAPTPPQDSPEPVELDKYSKEFAESGSLSEASLEALEKSGYPRKFVQQYIDGIKALAEQQSSTIYGSVGGREAYDAMVAWAADNMNADEIEAYNSAVASNDIRTASFAVKSLEARYRVANAGEPRFISGSKGQSSSGYESVAQMVAAMSDPRYKTDEAYRSEVARKISQSSVI